MRVTSVDNWKENLTRGQQYKEVSLKTFDNSHPGFYVQQQDLTPAYAEDKVRVTRRLCYLTQEDLLILHDEVAATPRHLPKMASAHLVQA